MPATQIIIKIYFIFKWGNNNDKKEQKTNKQKRLTKHPKRNIKAWLDRTQYPFVCNVCSSEIYSRISEYSCSLIRGQEDI